MVGVCIFLCMSRDAHVPCGNQRVISGVCPRFLPCMQSFFVAVISYMSDKSAPGLLGVPVPASHLTIEVAGTADTHCYTRLYIHSGDLNS